MGNMQIDEVKPYLDRYSELEALRERSIQAKAKDVSEYVCPERGRFYSNEQEPDTAHALRGTKIIDNTAQRGLRTAQNGMHSGLTPPSRMWFRYAFSDPDMNKYNPYKDRLEGLQKVAYNVLRRSNFYSSVHSMYAEIIGFSTGVMYQERDINSLVRYRPLTWGEYLIAQNDKGRVDTLYRPMTMTLRQIVQQFGSNVLTTGQQSQIKSKPDSLSQVIQAIQPRKDRDVTKADRQNMAYESVYFQKNESEKSILSKGGYESFPAVVCRYLTVGNDVYGQGGCAYETMADNKMLQDMAESILRAEHKLLDPPILVPSSMKGVPLRTGASGITYYDSAQPEGIRPLYELNFRIAEAAAEAQQVRERILSGFFHNLFLMITEEQRGNVTATQILQQQAEKLLQLGPFIERLQDELLDPVLEFVTWEILSNGLVEPFPKELQGADFKVEYISLLAQAQREVGTRAIDGNIAAVMQVVPIWPEARHLIDIAEAIRERADITGFPAKALRSEDDIAKLVKQEQQQQQAAQLAQMAQSGADTAQKLGGTPLDPNQPTALTDLLGLPPQQGVTP